MEKYYKRIYEIHKSAPSTYLPFADVPYVCGDANYVRNILTPFFQELKVEDIPYRTSLFYLTKETGFFIIAWDNNDTYLIPFTTYKEEE